jgi:hypothetical protein
MLPIHVLRLVPVPPTAERRLRKPGSAAFPSLLTRGTRASSYALHFVSHNNDGILPVSLRKEFNATHYAFVDFRFIWLAQSNYENAVVLLFTMLHETFVCCNEQALLGLDDGPQFVVAYSLIGSAPNVSDVVPESLKFLNANIRDVLIHKDSHALGASSAMGVTSSSANAAA